MSGGRGREPALRAHLRDARPLTGSTASGIGAMRGTGLHADVSGLWLTDSDGRELRRWSWLDVEGWDADGVAPDGADRADRADAPDAPGGAGGVAPGGAGGVAPEGPDGAGGAGEGSSRQVLTIRVRPAPLVVLTDACQLGPFLSTLSAAQMEGRRRAAKEARQEARRVEGPQRIRMRTRRLAVAAACLALVGGLAAAAPAVFAGPGPGGPGAHHSRGLLTGFGTGFGKRVLHLPKATAAPAPAPTSLAASPLAGHEAFGFLPYWALPDPGEVDLSGLTTVSYFSVDVNADGTIDESPTSSGWVGYQSQALANFITEAHHDGERAVLSATCFDQASLDALTRDPAAQAALGATLVSLVRAKNLDGVNLDFEGDGPTDRSGLDGLVATVSQAMHAADPAWQLTVDTYASSASDPGGFYDVAGMAPFVDAFVVMDYDMGGTFAAGPTAGTTGSYNDEEVATTYRAAAGASKVIVAMPLYGEDWPTVGPTAGDPATGPPAPVADDQIAATDTIYWDPSTGGPWAVYLAGRQWHQVWFDDPASLAAKSRLVTSAGLRGVGLWALGMAVGTGDQQAAVTGQALEPQPADGPVTVWRGPLPKWGKWGVPSSVGGSLPAGTSTAGSAPAANVFGSGGTPGASRTDGAAGTGVVPAANGVFEGMDVSLVAWPGAVPAGTTPAGSLGSFGAPGTSVACLAHDPSLPVVQIDGTSAYIVEARVPTDCATGTWAFVLPAGSTASSATSSPPTTGGGAGSGGATSGGAGSGGTGSGGATGSGGGTASGGGGVGAAATGGSGTPGGGTAGATTPATGSSGA